MEEKSKGRERCRDPEDATGTQSEESPDWRFAWRREAVSVTINVNSIRCDLWLQQIWQHELPSIMVNDIHCHIHCRTPEWESVLLIALTVWENGSREDMGERHRGPGPRAQQRGCGVDMRQQRQCLVWDLIHTILWGRDLNLSYFIEVLFTYSALCVCLEACRFEPQQMCLLLQSPCPVKIHDISLLLVFLVF